MRSAETVSDSSLPLTSRKWSMIRPRAVAAFRGCPRVKTMKTTILLVTMCVAAGFVVGRAETHQFTPTQFYNTWSAAHPPALRIKPGDRVVTKTVDAGGVDWNGKTVAQGPNPQTGPFYVEGAEAGDMIVVTFEKIDTNRAMAYSSSLLSPYATTPQA